MSHSKSQIKCETLRNCKIVGRLGRQEGTRSGESSGALCTPARCMPTQLHPRNPCSCCVPGEIDTWRTTAATQKKKLFNIFAVHVKINWNYLTFFMNRSDIMRMYSKALSYNVCFLCWHRHHANMLRCSTKRRYLTCIIHNAYNLHLTSARNVNLEITCDTNSLPWQ